MNNIIPIHKYFKENDRTFILLPQKIFLKLSPNSIDIHCTSSIEKYTIRNQSLNHFSLAKSIANYDIKLSKQHKHNKVIHWVSFNLHKYPKNYYKKYLILFKHFHVSENTLKC